jgi:hypothetical protein
MQCELIYLGKGILPVSQALKGFVTLPLCPIALFWVNGTSSVSLVRKASMFQAGRSSTMFTWENWINFLKEYGLPLKFFMCEDHQLSATLLQSRTWKRHCFSSKKTINARRKSFEHVSQGWELRYLLKEILPISQGFQLWDTSSLCTMAPF